MTDWLADLYAGEFDDFVPRRNSLARQAKAAGEGQLAKQIGACRKPTRAAWLVNLLAAGEAEQLAEALSLGEALAQAHRDASGDQLRELSAVRTRTVHALARRAAELGAAHDYQAPPSVIGEVAETIQAALADPSLAEGVRTGAMTATVRAAGFGPVDLFAPVSAEDGNVIDLASRREQKSRTGSARSARTRGGKQRPGGGPEASGNGPDPAEIRAAEVALTRAETALERAESAHRKLESAHKEATTASESAVAEHAAAAEEIAELERALADARIRAEAAAEHVEVTTERADQTGRELADSVAAIKELQAALAEAREGLHELGIDP